MQVDSLLADLQDITAGTIEALAKAGVDNDSADDLRSATAEIQTLRDEDLQDTLDAADGILKLISTIAMAIGGVLMGVALLGLCGAALLVSLTGCGDIRVKML